MERIEPSFSDAASAGAPSSSMGEMNSTPSVWYYYEDSKRVGPVSQTDMQSLLQKEQITAKTPVWCRGMRQWTPLMETSLWELNSPPPIMTADINNNIAWVIAFYPIFQIIFSTSQMRNNTLSTFDLSIISATLLIINISINFLMAWLDAKRLRRAGYKIRFIFLLSLWPFIYLFVRARKLKQTPYQGFVYLAIFVAIIFMYRLSTR